VERERAKAKSAYYDDALTLDEFKLEQERINQEVKAAQKAIDQWTIEIEAIRRSLDEALSLLVDPHRLYVEAPEGINLMLVQAVCEKIWILENEVAGLELTAPYLELLTVEARLALDAQGPETADDGPGDQEEVRVVSPSRASSTRANQGSTAHLVTPARGATTRPAHTHAGLSK
jgi:hypothetical protein